MHPLSFTGKRWIFADGCDILSPLQADALATLHERLRQERQLADPFSMTLDPYAPYDPTVFPDAQKAAERVWAAVKSGEKIALFGDYDCDGITSSAQMVRYFRRHDAQCLVLLPDRARDGYGLKPWAIERCKEAGITLLITVDTGIIATEAIELASTYGIDVIILDHHHCPDSPPPAYAILHPAFAPDYPEPYPAAAGVVFRFLHALEQRPWEDRDTDLALATVGTIADLVPLRGWNRRLVQDGLAAINAGRIHGPLGHMFAQAKGKNATLASSDIAFRIAPRINAAGRMADPMLGLEAVLNGGDALDTLERLNAERQQATLLCLDAAVQEAQGNLLLFPCLASADYPPGIIGLIAGKLTELTGRPSLVAHIANDACTASLRSTPAYHVTEALERCRDLLTTYGGHAQAAGCSFPLAHFAELRDRLNVDVAARVQAEELIPQLRIDASLSPDALSLRLCSSLHLLEPHGQGNSPPLFAIPRVTLNRLRAVGDGGKHLQAYAGFAKAIGFGLGHLLTQVDKPVDLACSLSIDRWQGREDVQLMVRDIRVSTTS